MLETHRARAVRRSIRFVRLAVVSGTLVAASVSDAMAQRSRPYESSALPRGYNGELADRYPSAGRLFNAFDYGRAVLNETLLNRSGTSVSRIERTEFDRLTKGILRSPPSMRPQLAAVEPTFARAAPMAYAALGWARTFSRQVYDVWADESIPATEKDRHVLELLGYYRSRSDIAISSAPKSMELLDGQLYSLSFRRTYEKFNGLLWAFSWVEQGLYESLVTASSGKQRKAQVDAVVGRFWQMLENAPEGTPFLIPRMTAVAPSFSRRYPEVSAILDNVHLMESLVADILASPEIPRGAKGREIDLAAGLFRSDTAYTLPYETWLQQGETMGVNNMGGQAVGFMADLPERTVARGASMAGMTQKPQASPEADMAGMQHGEMTPAQDTGRVQRLLTIQERMLADPVIRERVATDPVLLRLFGELGVTVAQAGAVTDSSRMSMPGMRHEAMQMPVPPPMRMGADSAADDRRRAVEFIVRLLSDPAVEGRIHADPELHRLWSDPDVQRRLAELRRVPPVSERGATVKPKPPQRP